MEIFAGLKIIDTLFTVNWQEIFSTYFWVMRQKKLITQEYPLRLEVIEGLSINYKSILYADLDNDKILSYRLSSRTTTLKSLIFQ